MKIGKINPCERLTIDIMMPRAFGFRMWLTCLLLRLAGAVSPVTIAVDVSETAQ